jgi:hypothetical protein
MACRSDESNAPARKLAALTFDSEAQARIRLLDSTFCDRCRRLSLGSQPDARSYIGLLIASPSRQRRNQQGSWTLHPYRCPWSRGWHVGRDRRVEQLLRNLLRKEVSQ